jgi:hypothetical protein
MNNGQKRVISNMRLVDVFDAANQTAVEDCRAANNYRSMSNDSRIDWIQCRETELVRDLMDAIKS